LNIINDELLVLLLVLLLHLQIVIVILILIIIVILSVSPPVPLPVSLNSRNSIVTTVQLQALDLLMIRFIITIYTPTVVTKSKCYV